MTEINDTLAHQDFERKRMNEHWGEFAADVARSCARSDIEAREGPFLVTIENKPPLGIMLGYTTWSISFGEDVFYRAKSIWDGEIDSNIIDGPWWDDLPDFLKRLQARADDVLIRKDRAEEMQRLEKERKTAVDPDWEQKERIARYRAAKAVFG